MDFLKQKKKSLYIFQYKCCKEPWWGDLKKNICFTCKKPNKKLRLNKMIGIGWFECECGRKYAGFSRGDVTSKCHTCEIENLPSFIVPGEKASKDEKKEKSHYCNMCKGSDHCPIVNACSKSQYPKGKKRY